LSRGKATHVNGHLWSRLVAMVEVNRPGVSGDSIKAIARVMKVSRNTVRAAIASDRPPKYERPPKGQSWTAPSRGSVSC
jgi:hypothetical protein